VLLFASGKTDYKMTTQTYLLL